MSLVLRKYTDFILTSAYSKTWFIYLCSRHKIFTKNVIDLLKLFSMCRDIKIKNSMNKF